MSKQEATSLLRVIRSALHTYDEDDRDWCYDLMGACAIGAIVFTDFAKQSGADSWVVRGVFDHADLDHAYSLLKMDGRYYIADPTVEQFGRRPITLRLTKAPSSLSYNSREIEWLDKDYGVHRIFDDTNVARKYFVKSWGLAKKSQFPPLLQIVGAIEMGRRQCL